MKRLIFLSLFFSSNLVAAPCLPPVGCTGIANAVSNTISVGGPISTAGAFTLTGAFNTTITVTANSVVTLPMGTHTLASNDGSNASGTWGISVSGNSGTVTNGVYSTGSYANPIWIASLDGSKLTGTVTANAISPGTYSISITGTAAGAPPSGSAGGDLTGSYPNPTVAALAISNSKIANATIDLATKITGVLPQINGGTNRSTGYGASQVIFQDAVSSTFNSTSNLTYTGAGLNIGNNINAIGANFSGLSTSTLVATDGSKNLVPASSSTPYAINISGTSAGAPPSGTAGGDLTGNYPSPTIFSGSVSNSKLALVAANTFKGNNTGSTTAPVDMTIAQAKSQLNLTGTNSGDLTLSGQNYLSLAGQALTANAVDLSGTNVSGILAAARFPAMTGDVTNTVGNLANTISNNAVTYAKFQQVAANSLIGNSTGSLANSVGITLGSTLAFSGSVLQTAAFSGDVSSPLNSFSTTLATVNGSPGTFGDGSHSLTGVVNGKGLLTSLSTNSIQIAESQVTNLVSDLAARISTVLNSAQILLGNGSNVATAVTPSGDWTMTNAGVSTIANNAVSNAKFRQSAALSVVANSTNVTANVADIVAASDAQVLRRSGTAIGFGAIDLTSSNAVSGALGFSNAGFGFTTATTGDLFYASATNTPSKLADVATGQVLTSGGVGASPAYSASPSLTGLTVTNPITGSVTGSSATTTTATNANNVASNFLSLPPNASYYPVFISSSINSNQPLYNTNGFNYNPSTNNLTVATFTGALVGNATTATNAVNIATTSTSASSNYYPVFVGATSNSNQPAGLYGGFSFIPGTGSLTLINSSTQPTNPTVTTQLNIASSTQASARIVLSGQEFGAASTTSTDGLAMLLGINTGNNRQLWLADSLLTASNTTNPVLRMGLLGVGNAAFIDSVATNGTSVLPFQIGNDGNTTKIAGSAITLDNATTVAAGNLTESAGSFILAGSSNSIKLYNAQIINYYTDAGSTLKGSEGPGRGFDLTLQSATGGNWLRLGSATSGAIALWTDGNVAANDNPNFKFDSSGFSANVGDINSSVGNLLVSTVNKGITIKSASVSAGTANAAVITGVILVAGAKTINNSYVDTNTVCYFSVVTTGGTVGTAYGVTVASGTVAIKSTNALDTSTGNVACIKGN